MSIYIMSRKFQKLTLQYAFLKLEKEEVEEICENKEKELQEYMRTHHPEIYENKKATTENKKESTKKEQSKEDKKKNNMDLEESIEYNDTPDSIPKNKDLKTLYRKIITKTHPDKIGSEKYSNLFNSAARAYEENNLAKLLEIAGVLNIELLELSSDSLLLLKENIKSLSSKINNLKQSVSWAWHLAKTEEQKQKIVTFVINSRR